jgi:hypothetical protein
MINVKKSLRLLFLCWPLPACPPAPLAAEQPLEKIARFQRRKKA